MKYKTLFRLAMKAIGIFFVLDGVSSLLGQAGWYFSVSRSPAVLNTLWPFLGQAGGSVLQLLFGLYLFFGGKWVVNKVIPSNRPYCPECAYDLTGAAVERCPECGTAFRWEDVKPKIEDRSPKIET